MENKEITITEETMESAASKILRGADEIESKFNLIKTEIAGISEIWKDENANKYIEQFEELEKQVPGFIAAANNCANFLNGVVRAYREQVVNPTNVAVQGRDISESTQPNE